MSQDFKESASDNHFLPDLCTVQAVFHLVLVAELLAIALSASSVGVSGFSWFRFGLISTMVLWIVLASAACLCPLRPWLARQSPEVAGGVSYCIVLGVTTLLSIIGVSAQSVTTDFEWHVVYANVAIAAIFAGVVLRYFYLQQQLRNQSNQS